MSQPLTLTARVLSVVLLLGTVGLAHAADQVVSNCSNDVELRADLTAMQASGGTLTFSCNTSTIALTSVLPAITKAVTIDGGGKITLSGTNATRIFVVDQGATLELEDIVLTNGSSGSDGGAIFNAGSLTLRRAELKNSVSGQSGGGIVTYGPLAIEDSTLSGNRAVNGAAVYARFALAVVSIEDSELHDNETTNTTMSLGGAVLLWDGASVTVDGSHFHDNRAVQGGAIHNPFANSTVTVRNSLFERNFAGLDSFMTGVKHGGALYSAGTLVLETTSILDNHAITTGGGVFAAGGTITIDDSLFRGGSADAGAGIACQTSCNLTVRRSTFYDNEARSGGGASVGGGSSAAFENVTFGGNLALKSGGALYNPGAIVTLSNCTLHENDAETGGIHVVVGTTIPKVFLRNTLVSGSSTLNCYVNGGEIVSLDGNLSDDTSCTSYLTNLHDLNGPQHDPLLVLSETPTSFGFLYVPQPGSPALDGGISSGAPATDQRGVPRPQGAAMDKGSVEVVDCGNVVCGDASGDGNVAAADALFALRTAVGSGACPLWRCDFNGDESITASDALAILRTAVGQSTTPNCPEAWDCAS